MTFLKEDPNISSKSDGGRKFYVKIKRMLKTTPFCSPIFSGLRQKNQGLENIFEYSWTVAACRN